MSEPDIRSINLNGQKYEFLPGEMGYKLLEMLDHAYRPITDAEVEAAWVSILETAYDVTTRDDIRAALEAARAVRETA